MRTGRIVDVDASLTGPLPPEARRELLLRMRTACENNTAVLRIVSAEAFPLDPHITVTAFRGRSVVFCTLSDDPQEGFCREYTLRDACWPTAGRLYVQFKRFQPGVYPAVYPGVYRFLSAPAVKTVIKGVLSHAAYRNQTGKQRDL